MKDKEYQPQARSCRENINSINCRKNANSSKLYYGFLICAFLRVLRQKIIFSLRLRGKE
jgi:hypothetical protein